MSTAMEFLAMGGYALYVWGSFGAVALVMLIELLPLLRTPRPAPQPWAQDEAGDDAWLGQAAQRSAGPWA